ncbi:glycosyltransferase [Nocardioides dubius]|uniref:Glycosyltransferase family 4 protein n=1 Tax=Nocardioides dubius TaxID=317019 RepID=A0ABN1U383_9ACTN
MKVLVEALAAEFGGIRTYVEHLLAAWESAFPDDDLTVLVPQGSDLHIAGHRRRELAIPGPDIVARPLAHTAAIRRLVAESDADAVLATLPNTSLRHPGVPLTVVVHDLRHEIRPEQFSRGRRLVRALAYRRAYALADHIVSVSQRSLDDLHRLHPGLRATPSTVVHHGADHVGAAAGERTGPAVAFAHHTNKNPRLVLQAWSLAQRRGIALPELILVGTGSERQALTEEAQRLGIADRVTMAPYLDDAAFGAVLAESAAVVFPSSFEGFGLPVLEGMLIGSPVVIGPEPATQEVAGGWASVAAVWTAEALLDAVVAGCAFDDDHLAAARAHAATFTWQRTAEQTRAALR